MNTDVNLSLDKAIILFTRVHFNLICIVFNNFATIASLEYLYTTSYNLYWYIFM